MIRKFKRHCKFHVTKIRSKIYRFEKLIFDTYYIRFIFSQNGFSFCTPIITSYQLCRFIFTPPCIVHSAFVCFARLSVTYLPMRRPVNWRFNKITWKKKNKRRYIQVYVHLTTLYCIVYCICIVPNVTRSCCCFYIVPFDDFHMKITWKSHINAGQIRYDKLREREKIPLFIGDIFI